MKKIFGTLAMALCLTAMVSCGGSNGGSNGGGDVVAKAKEYAKKVDEADRRGDYEAAARIQQEAMNWVEGLSEADQEKVYNALQ
ncbi:MAG: hypothetical protein IIW77_00525, partial [Bacteroidaceae bacterium]|nr:hypothetical protein [Bacteroidaceae bacterium]